MRSHASDLIDTRAYEKLMESVTSGEYLGMAVGGGNRCHHLACRAGDVDWQQLWVREGSQPLPRNYVITSRDVTGAPQFTVHVVDWNSAPQIAANAFEFVAPAGAKKIGFLPVTEAAP